LAAKLYALDKLIILPYMREGRMKTKLFILFILISVMTFYFGCTDKYEPAPELFSTIEESSCTNCHLNYSLLEQVATPLPPDTSESSGEG